MDIYVFSDESGVLDKYHNDYFVFGGLVFISKNDRDIASRKYISAEKVIRDFEKKTTDDEIKATTVSNKSKGKLFRALNEYEKFGVIVDQKLLFDDMFSSKKTKQRYLDWVYIMAIKNKFQKMIDDKKINPSLIENIYFYADEHTTATDGIYELKESLEQEFKFGIYNFEYMTHYSPLFPNLHSVSVKYCDSKTNTLVRAADIIANKLFFIVNNGLLADYKKDNFDFIKHPVK